MFFHLLRIQHAKKYIEPLHHQKMTKTQKAGYRKQWTRWRRLRNTKKFKLLYCEKSENKIKVEHPKKFKLLCLWTCTHGVFEIKIVALMCSSTFSTYNMPKNILNHYTTKKGRKHKKLGIRSNEHVEEGSGTQKNVNFCIARSQNKK